MTFTYPSHTTKGCVPLSSDVMILWNNTNEEWEDILGARYSISDYVEIYYEEYGQINRMYLLTK